MERDGHSGNAANKAEIGTAVEETQHPDIHQEKLNQQEGYENTGASSRIQFKEFLPSRSAQEYERGRRSIRNGPGRGASTSPPPAELGPGFAEYRGDVGGHGYDETEVDIIAVPCPGADPVQTWIYDHDVSSDSNYPIEVGSHLSRNTTQTSHSSSSSLRRASPWVTLKLRESASIARVFLYRHRTLQEGMNLKSLSNDLLEQILTIRVDGASRPLFFITHSIGGLVVKHALVRACEKSKYQNIMDHCHGVTFFGTPHRGSSYLSMPTLKNSIQDLLQLEAPLPRSLTDELLVDNPILTALHKKFVDIASELRLWSFYETRECLLSGTGAGLTNEVQFTAPLVSVKSALLEIWQEDIFGVESDHSHVASFGPNNDGILVSYLGDLAGAIVKAAELSRDHKHHPLYLDNYVKVEVIGFYEDPDAWNPAARKYVTQTSDADTETGSVIRLYQTKYPFKDFLRKGPEKCLSERLHDRSKKKGRNRSPHRSVPPPKEMGDDASNIRFGHNHATGTGPEIIITSGMERPSLAFLIPPAHTAPDLRPSSPESSASVSTTMSDPASLRRRDVAGDGPLTVDMLAKQQAETLLKEHELSSPAGFSRPDPSLRRFTWIHLPFNNPVWVKDLFNTLEKTQGHDFSRLFDYDNWESKHTQNRHSDTQPAYLKSHCKYLASTSITSPRPTPLFGPSPASLSSSPNCLYVYLPYLHFDTYHSMIKRRKIIRERRERGRAKPVPKHIADDESLELRMIWEYIGFDPPLNCRRTLDQFGHHSLRDTNSRDDDQMLYKLTKRDLSHTNKLADKNNTTAKPPAGSSLYSNKGSGASSNGSVNDDSDADPDAELKDGYVLMVDQLWLWSVDMTTLTTFFPRRHSTPTEGTLFHQADLRNSVYNELNGDLTGRTENTLDLAALIVWHAVIVFLERSTHPNLEIFRLFDEAIGMLAERMTLSMKQFRLLNVEDDEENEDESDWSDYESESPASIKKRHRRELERSERENRENTSALLELRDLEDELTTLQKLFETQESTIKQMREYYLKIFPGTTRNGQYYLNEALEYLDDFKQQTSDMLKRVDTTRNDYEKMLEMVQRQAQVDEVRWSRLQAELASSQNLSVMIFTTFTVIFLPLTFFTGLFGMNTIEWQDGDIPSLAFIGAVSLPASATLIILSLVAAFSWRVQRGFRATYKGLKASWKFAKSIYVERWEPVSRKEKKRRRRLEKKRKHQEKQSSHNDGTYDFWEMVKKQQRNMRYQIPDTNRKL